MPVTERTETHPYIVHRESLLSFSDGLIRHDSLKIERAVRRLLEEL